MKEVGWSKTEKAKKVVMLIVQDYGLLKRNFSLTFDVNEGTYMHRVNLNVQTVISRNLQINQCVNVNMLMCTIGWPELTAKLGGSRCGDGTWGVQNSVKKGGLGGPRNTTHYVKNG